jgi:SOS-response transcriptional repressor LexA
MFTMLNNNIASTLNTKGFSLLTMTTLAERLQWAIDRAGIKKIDLAKACGVSRGAVSQWFNGSTKSLEGTNLTNAAKATGVNPHWLATGLGARIPLSRDDVIEGLRLSSVSANSENDETHTDNLVFLRSAMLNKNTLPGPSLNGMIPVISWVQAGVFCSSPDLFHVGDADDWIPALRKFGPHAYALRVQGDSMVSPYQNQKSYPEGCFIFVDPDKSITNGCRVVARIHDEETATFKVYAEDAGKRYLKPLNPQYPTIEMTSDMHICGVVVGSWMDE